MTAKETFTLVRAFGTVRHRYGTASLMAWKVISNTAKDDAAVDLEEFGKQELALKIQEMADMECAEVVSVEYKIDRDVDDESARELINTTLT